MSQANRQRLKVYQNSIAEQLRSIYDDVETEWSAISYTPSRKKYRPEVDIAVGPFAIDRQFIGEYNDLAIKTDGFIDRLIHKQHENIKVFGIRNF
jgi:hypothetical protein